MLRFGKGTKHVNWGAIWYVHAMTAVLEREVKMLRSLAISIVGEDPEGNYRPEFVRRVLSASSKKPTRKFISEKQFLDELLCA
jgi:hypothetical protein